MRSCIALLLLLAAARAESWVSLEQYVRACTRIVRAKAVGMQGREIRFKLLECWKGRPLANDEEYRAYPGEHGVPGKIAGEIVFFFTKGERHSTSFPVVDGRVLYAATDDSGILSPKPLRRWYELAECKERVRILQLPMTATADRKFRLQSRGIAKGAAGQPQEFEIERDGQAWHGSEIFFDEVETTVHATVGGKLVEGLRAQASVWPSGEPRIEVFGLGAVKELDSLVLECAVIRALESKRYRFDKLAPGKSAELSAPPFALEVEADEKKATVICTLVRDAKLREIENALDTRTLTPMWAIQALSLNDDKFRFLASLEGAANHRAAVFDYAITDPPGAPLQFPLSLAIAIPTKVEKERLRFEFRNFKLPR